MNAERVVLVDMDGVVADFTAGAESAISEAYPELLIVPNRPNIYFRDVYPAYAEQIKQLVRMPGFTRNLPLVTGALDGWEKMLGGGYKPRICSAPLENTPRMRSEKLDWLEQHFVPRFGYSVVDEAIIDKDKLGHHAIALIDDRETIRGSENATWQHIVYSQSYNLTATNDFRLIDWRDPQLLPLLQLSRDRYIALNC